MRLKPGEKEIFANEKLEKSANLEISPFFCEKLRRKGSHPVDAKRKKCDTNGKVDSRRQPIPPQRMDHFLTV